MSHLRARVWRERLIVNRLREITELAFDPARDQNRMDTSPDQVADSASQESGRADVDMDAIGGGISDLAIAQTDGPFDGLPPHGNRQH